MFKCTDSQLWEKHIPVCLRDDGNQWINDLIIWTLLHVHFNSQNEGNTTHYALYLAQSMLQGE